jgi:hypothetical protein
LDLLIQRFSQTWAGPGGEVGPGRIKSGEYWVRLAPGGSCPEEVLLGDRLRRDSILDRVLTHKGGQGVLDRGHLPGRNRVAPEAVEFCKDTICIRQGLYPPRVSL